MRKDNPIERASAAHTDLNVFASLVSILEGGHIYSSSPRVQRSVERIISICQKEQSLLLHDYDEAVAAIRSLSHTKETTDVTG